MINASFRVEASWAKTQILNAIWSHRPEESLVRFGIQVCDFYTLGRWTFRFLGLICVRTSYGDEQSARFGNRYLYEEQNIA